MQDVVNRSEKHRGRWMKVLLGLSLAANFAFLGFVAGAALRHDGEFKRSAQAPGLNAFGAPYVMALDRQDRRAMLRALRAAPQDRLPDRATRRAMFEDVIASLKADHFDLDALRSAVDRQAGVAVSVQQRFQTAWLALVAEMSNEERHAYADAVQAALRKAGGRR
jgi:uncharacterized membrane protein